MGQIVRSLVSQQTNPRTIFNHRFVVEICEKVHVHYRNLRILMSLHDWLEMARGMRDSLTRWESQGSPEPHDGTHIELCRKDVAKHPVDDGHIRVSLNNNLYNKNGDKIYSLGAGFEEPQYIHLKIRDLRLEMSIDEFKELSKVVAEANSKLEPIHAE